jgi:Protein of unknown function (DUF4232)
MVIDSPPRPPSQDELDALIREARDRQGRRRFLGVALVAMAAGVALGINAVTSSGAGHKVPQARGLGGPASAPSCQSTQLSATVGFQASTQQIVGGAQIKNASDQSCALPTEWPRVRLSANRKRLAVVQDRLHGASAFPVVRVLAPGGRALVPMQWGNWCGTPHQQPSHGGEPLVLLRVHFALRFGPDTVVTATSMGEPPCLEPQDPSALIIGRATPSG